MSHHLLEPYSKARCMCIYIICIIPFYLTVQKKWIWIISFTLTSSSLVEKTLLYLHMWERSVSFHCSQIAILSPNLQVLSFLNLILWGVYEDLIKDVQLIKSLATGHWFNFQPVLPLRGQRLVQNLPLQRDIWFSKQSIPTLRFGPIVTLLT